MRTFLVALAAFVGFVAAFGFAAAVLALDAEPPVTLYLLSSEMSLKEKIFWPTFLAGCAFRRCSRLPYGGADGGRFLHSRFSQAPSLQTRMLFAGTFFAAVALVVVAAEDFAFVAVGFVRELAAEDFGVGLAFDLATTFVGGFATGFATDFVAGLF